MSGRRRFPKAWVVAAAWVPALACATAEPRPPASPAPELSAPARAIPGDLDVAVRLDLVQLRRVLGESAMTALELKIADARADAPGGRLLEDALRRADVVWIGLRPGLGEHLTDNVVVLRGDFTPLNVRDYRGDNPWEAPVDLGGDLRRFDRSAPERRSAPARLYALSNHVLVFVSEAEIDSVERRIEKGAGDARVEPPERGAASVAARVQPLIRHIDVRFPAVARLLSEASRLEAHVSLDSVGLRGSIEVRFTDPAAAEQAREAADELVEQLRDIRGPLGQLSRGLTARTVGESLVFDLGLDGDATGALMACLALGQAC